MQKSDRELIEQYNQGDIDALEELVTRYKKPLYGFIVNMLGNPGDADEIFQETWFKALKGLKRYRHDRFLSWMFRIARNVIIDKWRKNKNDLSLDATDAEGFSLDQVIASDGESPDSSMQNSDIRRLVGAAVNRLPREQKEVFLMRVNGDVPFKEIARIQSVSINTALARMSYAVKKLKDDLRMEFA